jgi:hypothetical protein
MFAVTLARLFSDNPNLNFAKVVPGRKIDSFIKDKRREVRLRYWAKVNGRSTIIGPDYVAIICPLCGIKLLLSYCRGLKDGARTFINPPSPSL